MKTLYFALILLSFPALAQVKVQIVDPEIDSSSLEKDYQVEREAIVYNSIPDMNKRDQLLKDFKAMAGWDELQKDIFYMDLESKTVSELEEKYPDLKKADLKTLKDKRLKK